MKRVYHPTLDSYQDVDDKAVKAWSDAGWLERKPKHVSGELPPVGEHPGFAQLPVLEDVSRTTTTSTGGSARTSSGSARAGGSTTGRGAGSRVAGSKAGSSTAGGTSTSPTTA